MEHDEIIPPGCPGDDLKHLTGGVSTDEEHSFVDLDQANGVGNGAADRVVIDAMASGRRGDPHACCVPHYHGPDRESRRPVDRQVNHPLLIIACAPVTKVVGPSAPPAAPKRHHGIMDGVADLIVVTGPPGAGKSTTSKALSKRFARSALVAGDDFFAFIDQGSVAPWAVEAHHQNGVVVGAAPAASGGPAGGYTVVYDGVIGPWFVDAIAIATGRAGWSRGGRAVAGGSRRDRAGLEVDTVAPTCGA